MNVMKTILFKIGHVMLSIVRILRKIICCRRRRETEHLLPMTVRHIVADEEQQVDSMHEFNSTWESWPDGATSSTARTSSVTGGKPEEFAYQTFQQEDSLNDFFKDMVPQIRKPKKIYLVQDPRDSEEPVMFSNRLAMDPKAILSGPDLGTIEDNPSNWGDDENMDDSWDPDALIRETKRIEREKRLAEHQRQKLEKESRRALKQEQSANSLLMSLSDSKDKAKSS